mgnify:CR=1 FL=1
MKKRSECTVAELVGALAKRAPFDYAEEWDNVGLLAGDATVKVTGVVVAVNLGPESLEAAEKKGANVVVCHHPPIFKPISKFTKQSSPWLFQAVLKNISVIALHTNYDLASEDSSRKLAATLGFQFKSFLTGRGGEEPRSIRQVKFVTYVPEKNLEAVRTAVCEAGAGRIGEYEQCSFSWEGEGTFFGGKDTKPTVGRSLELTKASERRLEIVTPAIYIDKVVAAARKAHPYEEMAYDVILLENPSKTIGYGFIGTGKMTFRNLLENVKGTFLLKDLIVAGPGLYNSEMDVTKVAFSPGSGSSFVGAAAAKGADVYICGEVGYHQMLEARTKNLTLMVLGHSYSERFFVETLSTWVAGVVDAGIEKVFERVHESVF